MKQLLLLMCLALVNTSIVRSQHCCRHGQVRALPSASAERSDSISLNHTHLFLDFTDWDNQVLKGHAQLDFTPLLAGQDRIVFDLEGLMVDSVRMNEVLIDYSHNGALLVCWPTVPLTVGESMQIDIHYHGQPIQDPSGWGGFYWQNDYAFNLGVGFEADPHSFGRCWFPCFDNFVERCTFSTEILTNGGRTAYSGGLRSSVQSIGQDSLLTVWELDEPIPSYLVSVAVSDYVHTEQQFTGLLGDIPVWLAARQQDTSAMMSSFSQLPVALEGFESFFGPFRWSRIGYVLVPFSSGAMEHATNIAYPVLAANGSQAFASLMAHELAHHWWGDLVTCRTAEDMWLNEGFATYCEALFFEASEGEDSYHDYIRTLHKEVLTEAHLQDGAYLPVSGIDHEQTYGIHVYLKGATVLHNLRSYIGEDFFPLLTLFLEDHQFSDISSETLRDYLANGSEANMEAFFENWVFSPGFPGFRLGSSSYENSGENYVYTLEIDQYLLHAPSFYTDVPFAVSFLADDGSEFTTSVNLTGASTLVEIEVPFIAKHILLNRDEGLNQAVLAEEAVINSPGIRNLPYSEFRLNTSDLGTDGETWVRVENHWTAADVAANQPEFKASTDRFWRIYHDFDATGSASGRIRYFGNPNASNYFDPSFFAEMSDFGLPEDSLILLYRPLETVSWQEHPDYVHSLQGINTDYQGYFDFRLMESGDYAWGYRTGQVGIHPFTNSPLPPYPNPTRDRLITDHLTAPLFIFDLNGRMLEEFNEPVGYIDVHHLPVGCYLLKSEEGQYPFFRVD